MTFSFGSRPDRGSPPHDRAAVLIAERIDTRLEPEEAAWLEAHLANCRTCRALADAYASDRLELQALRRREPIEPPRDLWARTAAALDRETGRGPRGERRARRRPSPAPAGAAAGLLVVAVVVGASILSGRPLPSPAPASEPPASPTLVAVSVEATATAPPATPAPTPLAIPSGDVPYLAADDEGNQALFTVNVSEVCSADGAACAPIPASSPRAIDLPDSPHAVILSPDDQQLVVVDAGTTGEGGAVLVVPVPTDGAGPSVAPTPPPTATPPPGSPPPNSAPPTSAPPTSEPPTSAPPTGSPTTPPPTSAPPPASPSPRPTLTASATASAAPSESPTTSDPSSPTPTVTATVSPAPPSATPSAAATAAAAPIAIAEDVVVDSETAAFSPDGRHLAFSARPADGSHGPDIYVWATDGTSDAVPLTTDHRSVFAGWVGELILGSRVVEDVPEGAPSSVAPSASVEASVEPSGSVPAHSGDASAAVDPSASASAPVEASAPSEPPASVVPSASVAPSASVVVVDATPPAPAGYRGESFLVDPATGEMTAVIGQSLWRPSVDPTGSHAVWWDGTMERDEAGDWRAGEGRLVLGPWESAGAGSAAAERLDVLAEGPIVDWDTQWDSTGTHLAVWIADPDDPATGKLSLYVVDPETGRLQAGAVPLRDERALPGFAINDNRLVWATPPGQNGEASHVRVLAWTADGVGTAETSPAEEIVVIR